MSRLAKHCAGRQQELFARADLPEHTPRLEHYAAVERGRVQHQPRPVLWEGMGSWVRQLCSFAEDWQRTGNQDARMVKTMRMLTIDKVRASADDDGLALVERHLADFRNTELLNGFTRAQIGAMLVEVRNRRHLLALGRDRAKPKGPRLDPVMMPLEAIDRLIQRHPNLALVERLRIERARRLTISARKHEEERVD